MDVVNVSDQDDLLSTSLHLCVTMSHRLYLLPLPLCLPAVSSFKRSLSLTRTVATASDRPLSLQFLTLSNLYYYWGSLIKLKI